jgi:hypothetical protein
LVKARISEHLTFHLSGLTKPKFFALLHYQVASLFVAITPLNRLKFILSLPRSLPELPGKRGMPPTSRLPN